MSRLGVTRTDLVVLLAMLAVLVSMAIPNLLAQLQDLAPAKNDTASTQEDAAPAY